MSANIDSMLFVQHSERDLPWHYSMNPELVELLHTAPDSARALHCAGLDWTVESRDIQLCDGKIIPGYHANVRSTDGTVLGVVGDRYKIVQNVDAFSFTDGIIGEGAVYETAGALNGGRKVWLLAKLEQMNLGGDEAHNYLCFANTHDGSGSVKVCITPVRVVCNNTLNMALQGAKRSFSMRHTTNIDKRIDEAKEVLGLAAKYQVELADYADYLIRQKVSDITLRNALNQIFDPKGEKPTELQKKNAKESKQAFYVCYAAPDIAKYVGTAWGAINAMSDLVGHSLPHRNPKEYAANNWGRIMDGHPLLDKMVDLVG